MRRHMGCVSDRTIEPYVTYIRLPERVCYVDFLFRGETEYQKTRFYGDERPMKLQTLIDMMHPTQEKG